MKKYLAVFLGSRDTMDEWMARPDRKELEQKGMQGWMDWAKKYESVISELGGPLGKTKKVSKSGIEDIRNDMGAFSVVEANSHEEAAKMFENHPHFMIFPGDRVEVMEIMPIPKM